MWSNLIWQGIAQGCGSGGDCLPCSIGIQDLYSPVSGRSVEVEMRRNFSRCTAIAGVAALVLCLSACARGAPAARGSARAAGTPVHDAWTTPSAAGTSFVARPAAPAALQPAPRAVGPTPGAQAYAEPSYAAPTPSGGFPGVAPYPGSPPPPPPGGYTVTKNAAAPATSPAPAPVTPRTPVGARSAWAVPAGTYTCGLPCKDGISQWHLRGVLGYATFSGTDSPENCTYWGLDVGRTFCGCWGWDLYYRYNSGRFTREPTPGVTFKDGGEFHHFGTKLTYERGFGRNSRLYWWTGFGGGYFTTSKYIANDEGFEVFGEAGLGYVLSRSWRLRAGVDVHGMDTDVTRRLQDDDGQSRWLWIVAPVVEVEFSF